MEVYIHFRIKGSKMHWAATKTVPQSFVPVMGGRWKIGRFKFTLGSTPGASDEKPTIKLMWSELINPKRKLPLVRPHAVDTRFRMLEEEGWTITLRRGVDIPDGERAYGKITDIKRTKV